VGDSGKSTDSEKKVPHLVKKPSKSALKKKIEPRRTPLFLMSEEFASISPMSRNHLPR
jgi:hypothetical protein